MARNANNSGLAIYLFHPILNTMIKALIIDDHEIVRMGLKVFLNNLVPHYTIDEACDKNSALKKIRKDEYHLVIMDINIPGTDSIELVTAIRTIRPKARILMISMNAEEIYAKRFLQLGVSGYISKSAPENELTLAIKTVLQDKKYIGPVLRDMLVDELCGKNQDKPFNNLSAREFQILQYLLQGKSSADIVSDLSLHSSTVATYRARIFKKMNCKNVFELNTLARLHNIKID